MELKDLVGEHTLDAVDMFHEMVRDDYGEDDCEMIRFRLDGVAYLVIEDPQDGYRSAMKEIRITDSPMKNVFPGQKVLCSHRTKGEFGSTDDVLEIRSVVTGKVVLVAGTESIDDYYPGFVGTFIPENL